MSNLSTWLFGRRYTDRNSVFDVRDAPILPTPDTGPVRSSLPPEPGTDALPPLKNWSHPFKDTRNPLQQLTHLAKATAGYYPLGINGLWHGGVHFDSGTADGLDQSSVQCLADGEVVAYRIDTRSPTTAYWVHKLSVKKPFSRNFVLVRHRLQPPKIEGSPDTPPSLTFYSLYLHLQDWAVYQEDPALARPAFWPEAAVRRVKDTENDVRPGQPEQRGLNVRNQAAWRSTVIDLLPRGAEVTVSGEGDYRKLENTLGPAKLTTAEGSLRGYVSITQLRQSAGDEYHVATRWGSLNVRAEPSFHSEVLEKLQDGTQVTVSGEGEYRKLERIDQYVHFKSLQGALEPLASDRVVVLDRPIPIKAGELIGHLGRYQDCHAECPEKKLHLEVFSTDTMRTFIAASRAWADRLPAQDKTWLKLAKGTAVVAHQDNYSATQWPILSAANTLSDADLLVPNSLLEGLPADRKIAVPATADRRACNWYRLDRLLHDADNNLLDGWVREEVGVTPWVSPWSWEGYDVIFDYDSPREVLASFLRAVDHFSETELERYGPMADEGDKGPLKSRLYDIIDRNRDGKMTAEELQAALRLPAHAQSISQLIVRYESEWYYKPQKWDMLDELLGHSGSTPHLNWLAEKEWVKQLSWWSEVAEKVGLPAHGRVYHFHPLGLVGCFSAVSDDNDLKWLKVPYGQLTFDAEGNDIEDESHRLYRYFSRVAHWPGGVSGVTIGRGYDLGQRPDPGKDLCEAGVEEPLLSWLIGAKGLQGDKAKTYLAQAPADIRKHKITRKQQYDLFLPVYDYMKTRVIQISSVRSNEENYGVLSWNEIDRRIRDIVIDLIYRGDYHKDTRPFIQRPFVENDLGKMKEVMSSRDNWKGVPDDRFQKRAEYLKK